MNSDFYVSKIYNFLSDSIVKFCYFGRDIYLNIYTDNNSQSLNLDANLFAGKFYKGF